MSALLGKPCITIKCHWCGSTSLTDLKRDINSRFPSNWADILGFSLHVSSCPWQVSLNGCDRVLDNIKFAYKTLLFTPQPSSSLQNKLRKGLFRIVPHLTFTKPCGRRLQLGGRLLQTVLQEYTKWPEKRALQMYIKTSAPSNRSTEVLLPAILEIITDRLTGRAD